MTLVTRSLVTGLRCNLPRWPHGTAPTPDGCRWCGHARSYHAICWVESAKLHTWKPPTSAQRLKRMRIRRALRIQARAQLAAGQKLYGWGYGYHANAYARTGGNPDEPICADCHTYCHRYQRIQDRLDRARWEALPAGCDQEPPF